eukprot:11532025-Ditylum_brightwellii.AAC.1
MVWVPIDNKGVVTRANNQIEYKYDFPYNTLEPDWDVIVQSAKYLQGIGFKLKIEHVKSHQDDKDDFEKLNLPAQLNVRADELATTYRKNIANLKHLYLSYPSIMPNWYMIVG